jgi:hypothetical protein
MTDGTSDGDRGPKSSFCNGSAAGSHQGSGPVVSDERAGGAVGADGGHRDQNRYRLVHRPAAGTTKRLEVDRVGRAASELGQRQPGVTELTRPRGKAGAYWTVSMFSGAFDIG